MHEDGYISSVNDLYFLKMHMSINDSYGNGMSASGALCLQELKSGISRHGSLSDKTRAETVPPD